MITKRGAWEWFRIGFMAGTIIMGILVGIIWSYDRSSLMSEIKTLDNQLISASEVP